MEGREGSSGTKRYQYQINPLSFELKSCGMRTRLFLRATGADTGSVYLFDHIAGPRVWCELKVTGTGKTADGNPTSKYAGTCVFGSGRNESKQWTDLDAPLPRDRVAQELLADGMQEEADVVSSS